jgi:hypothetical protein
LDVNEEGLVMAKTPADWSAAMPIFWQSDNWKTRNHASPNALSFVGWRALIKFLRLSNRLILVPFAFDCNYALSERSQPPTECADVVREKHFLGVNEPLQFLS